MSRPPADHPHGPSSPHRLQVTIRSDPSQVSDVRKAIEQLCAGNGFDDQSAADVGLCVNEALANIMRHAYGGATSEPIVITAECSDDRVCISFRDWGNGINPAQLANDDIHHLPEPPEGASAQMVPVAAPDLHPGGLGMICLRRLMDELQYLPQPDGMLLTMVKQNSAPRHR